MGFITGSLASYIGRLRPLNTQGLPFSCTCLVHRWSSMTSSMPCPSPLRCARQASRWVLVTMCHVPCSSLFVNLDGPGQGTARGAFNVWLVHFRDEIDLACSGLDHTTVVIIKPRKSFPSSRRSRHDRAGFRPTRTDLDEKVVRCTFCTRSGAPVFAQGRADFSGVKLKCRTRYATE